MAVYPHSDATTVAQTVGLGVDLKTQLVTVFADPGNRSSSWNSRLGYRLGLGFGRRGGSDSIESEDLQTCQHFLARWGILNTDLVGVTESAIPRLNLLSHAIRLGGFRSRLCSNVRALPRSVFNSDVVVFGDVELLSGVPFDAFPYLEVLPVGSQIRSEVEAVFGALNTFRCQADLGAAGIVNPLLERVE